jgi:hypothetical protein
MHRQVGAHSEVFVSPSGKAKKVRQDGSYDGKAAYIVSDSEISDGHLGEGDNAVFLMVQACTTVFAYG